MPGSVSVKRDNSTESEKNEKRVISAFSTEQFWLGVFWDFETVLTGHPLVQAHPELL